MIIAFFVVAGPTALFFLTGGVMKLVRPVTALRDAGMGWVDDIPLTATRLIGLAEVLGAVGLVLPVALRTAAVLSPIAAVCLGVVMVGAVVVHVRRGESPGLQIGLLVLATAAAVLGFAVV